MRKFLENMAVGVVVGLFFVSVTFGLINKRAKDSSYKKGQIDALTGKIKYRLITNNDSTKTWELKKK